MVQVFVALVVDQFAIVSSRSETSTQPCVGFRFRFRVSTLNNNVQSARQLPRAALSSPAALACCFFDLKQRNPFQSIIRAKQSPSYIQQRTSSETFIFPTHILHGVFITTHTAAHVQVFGTVRCLACSLVNKLPKHTSPSQITLSSHPSQPFQPFPTLPRGPQSYTPTP